MPTLPIKPETLRSLQDRFPAAVASCWDGSVISAGDRAFADRPGRHRKHVFDWERNGMIYRLIISREWHEQTGELLHVSASQSTREGGPVPKSKRFRSPESAAEFAADMFSRIALPVKPVKVLDVNLSPAGVVHLALPWPIEFHPKEDT